jgi:hypothetical protein
VTAPSGPRSSPWRPNDLVRIVAFSIIALSGIGVAWYGASGKGALSDQTIYLNIAVVAIVVAGAGNLAWLAAGRRSVGLRRRALLRRWDAPVIARGRFAPKRRITLTTPAPTGQLVRAEGMSFAHRPGCPLVTGKPTVAVTEANPPLCSICHP